MPRHALMQSEVLEGAPLRYAPENELGVVFLFADLAKKWRLRVDAIRPGFPDCIAYQKIQGKEKRIRIEFELKSRYFLTHRHNKRGCDWLVCWEYNWPDAPKNLNLVELRKEYGLGFNVWIQPHRYTPCILKPAKHSFSLPSQCHAGDLVLFYDTSPDRRIAHVCKAVDRSMKVRARWKPGLDTMGHVRLICSLKAPIFLEDIKNHRILKTSHFVRGSMRGRPNASEYWPYLYDLIVRKNPGVKRKLTRYAPENLR
jgi:hypothetical protein